MFDKALMKTFAASGAIGIVAGVLLWVLVTDVRADQRATRDEHQRMREEFAAIKNITGQGDMAQQQILWILQTMCVNQAKSETVREDCLRKVR